MPLTKIQSLIVKLLSENRSPDSYLAGGAALNFEPHTYRYSNDLDYFQDSIKRVTEAYDLDSSTLKENNYSLEVVINTPGFVRVVASKNNEQTKIEWVHDTAWRFLPTIKDSEAGYLLHPIDVALNKLLALAGRDEPRDYLDVIELHSNLLSLGAMCWAAVGKDPGFTPNSLLEILKRKGRYQVEDFNKLSLTKTIDLPGLKTIWLEAINSAEKLFLQLPAKEIGCLYYSQKTKQFVSPESEDDAIPHYGRPGGVLPLVG
jgi:predicted nucleotidyltransferase component of viral defense system